MINKKIIAKEFAISVQLDKNSDFFSLTDIARHKNAESPDVVVQIGYEDTTLLNFWVFGRC